MHRLNFHTVMLAGFVLLGGCASPRPVLYPNVQLEAVGEAYAERDIAECMALAEQAGAHGRSADAGEVAAGAGAGAAVGAASGAVYGDAGRGAAAGAAAAGTATVIRQMFRARQPDPVFRRFVEHCLRERGYEPIGWR